MRLHLDILPGADRDLVAIADHIAKDSLDAAIRFLHSARRSMEFLTTMPKAGPEYLTPNRLLAGLRKWSVDGHRDYLIFYRSTNDAIEVFRVIHGARDIPTILADEIPGQ
jgi:toxin ParE1/3/4